MTRIETMDDWARFIDNYPRKVVGNSVMRPGMMLGDGCTLSIQASELHYCTPRSSSATFYTAWEIGFPSKVIPEILEWAENSDDPTETVYGYVPVDVILNVIKARGGTVQQEKTYEQATQDQSSEA
jgi:hypothetical protein